MTLTLLTEHLLEEEVLWEAYADLVEGGSQQRS
jgi:hypothetical protein